MCSSVRRASRALTQLYEQALGPLGLRATQFTILQVLSLTGEVSQGQLGEMLAMDSTSLTRTLEIMRREGWIADRRGEDRRQRWLAWPKPEKRSSIALFQTGRKFKRACTANWAGRHGKIFFNSQIK
jgi:DNA-binding MarR family transcriptional regulator